MEASNYQKHKKSLKARHVPGSHNVIADDLSRRNQIQHTEWLAFSLSPLIFKQIIKLFLISADRSVCNQTKQQGASVRISHARLTSVSSVDAIKILGKTL